MPLHYGSFNGLLTDRLKANQAKAESTAARGSPSARNGLRCQHVPVKPVQTRLRSSLVLRSVVTDVVYFMDVRISSQMEHATQACGLKANAQTCGYVCTAAGSASL